MSVRDGAACASASGRGGTGQSYRLAALVRRDKHNKVCRVESQMMSAVLGAMSHCRRDMRPGWARGNKSLTLEALEPYLYNYASGLQSWSQPLGIVANCVLFQLLIRSGLLFTREILAGFIYMTGREKD